MTMMLLLRPWLFPLFSEGFYFLSRMGDQQEWDSGSPHGSGDKEKIWRNRALDGLTEDLLQHHQQVFEAVNVAMIVTLTREYVGKVNHPDLHLWVSSIRLCCIASSYFRLLLLSPLPPATVLPLSILILPFQLWFVSIYIWWRLEFSGPFPCRVVFFAQCWDVIPRIRAHCHLHSITVSTFAMEMTFGTVVLATFCMVGVYGGQAVVPGHRNLNVVVVVLSNFLFLPHTFLSNLSLLTFTAVTSWWQCSSFPRSRADWGRAERWRNGGWGGRRGKALIHEEKGAGIEVQLALGLKPAENTLHSADASWNGILSQTRTIMEELSQAWRTKEERRVLNPCD